MSDRRDDDLRDMLDRLEDDLEDLRVELEADEERRRPNRRRRSDRRRDRDRSLPLPRPPNFGEFLRFTEEYTIPTIISMLKATIRSLELFREVLRLADPGRSGRSREEAGTVQTRLNDAGRFAAGRASDQLTRRLDDLRTALSEANLPEESESRSLIEDIRALSSEIEARIDESERTERERTERGRTETERERDSGRRRSDASRNEGRDAADGGRSRGNGDDRGVRIDVFDESDAVDPGGESDGDAADDDADSNEPTVDIESELDSIKEEVHGAGRDGEIGAKDGTDEGDENGAAGDDENESGEADDDGASGDRAQ